VGGAWGGGGKSRSTTTWARDGRRRCPVSSISAGREDSSRRWPQWRLPANEHQRAHQAERAGDRRPETGGNGGHQALGRSPAGRDALGGTAPVRGSRSWPGGGIRGSSSPTAACISRTARVVLGRDAWDERSSSESFDRGFRSRSSRGPGGLLSRSSTQLASHGFGSRIWIWDGGRPVLLFMDFQTYGEGPGPKAREDVGGGRGSRPRPGRSSGTKPASSGSTNFSSPIGREHSRPPTDRHEGGKPAVHAWERRGNRDFVGRSPAGCPGGGRPCFRRPRSLQVFGSVLGLIRPSLVVDGGHPVGRARSPRFESNRPILLEAKKPRDGLPGWRGGTHDPRRRPRKGRPRLHEANQTRQWQRSPTASSWRTAASSWRSFAGPSSWARKARIRRTHVNDPATATWRQRRAGPRGRTSTPPCRPEVREIRCGLQGGYGTPA